MYNGIIPLVQTKSGHKMNHNPTSTTPACTVIVPAYNSSKTINKTLSSIIANLSADDRIIVVDDGSKDDTADTCKGIDQRVTVVTQTNAGPATARNKGISMATTELVAFCDADDLWEPGKLDKQRALFRSNPELGLCFTDYRIVDEEGNIETVSAVKDRQLPLEHSLQSMLIKNPVMTSSTVSRRSVMNDIDGFPQSYSEKHKVFLGTEDYEAWIAIAQKYPVAMVNEVLATYLVQSGSLFQTRSNNAAIDEEVAERRVQFINSVARQNKDKVSASLTRKAIADYYFRSSYLDRQDGQLAAATKSIVKSLTYWPFRAKSWFCIGYLGLLGLKSKMGGSNKP